jgi:hypothetical protein
MTYTLNIFSNLCASYPTWTELSTYLKSEAGGALVIVEDEEQQKAIIHYNKKVSNMTANHVRWCRSVIWDMITNRPIAVAPPKAFDTDDTFMEQTGPLQGFYLQDYLDGTTLTVYGDGQIASRTKFGASGGYYSRKTFKDMMAEATDGLALKDLVPEGYTFLSVLLQHPEHRVVERIAAPAIYRLHAGRVEDDGSVTIDEQIGGTPAEMEGPAEGQTVRSWFAALASNRPWEWQGVVFKDVCGRRWRLRSNSYRMVRSLRGTNPRADVRFFMLRRAGLVKTYLYYYPEDKKQFWDYECALRRITNEIYAAYCAVYKERSIDIEAVNPMYKTHVRGLHGLYLSMLRPEGKTVSRAVAVEHINNQPLPRLLFMLNFDKRPVDT